MGCGLAGKMGFLAGWVVASLYQAARSIVNQYASMASSYQAQQAANSIDGKVDSQEAKSIQFPTSSRMKQKIAAGIGIGALTLSSLANGSPMFTSNTVYEGPDGSGYRFTITIENVSPGDSMSDSGTSITAHTGDVSTDSIGFTGEKGDYWQPVSSNDLDFIVSAIGPIGYITPPATDLASSKLSITFTSQYSTLSKGTIDVTSFRNGTYSITDAQLPVPLHTLAGDISGDGIVDANDAGMMAENWLVEAAGNIADISLDGRVDFVDFAMLANDWGKQEPWYVP
jgi:hypothetical protein